MTNDFVSGGYFIARYISRRDYAADGANAASELLPEKLFTASDCIVDTVPNTWTLDWTSDPTETRQEKAAQFGLSNQAYRKVAQWSTTAFELGLLGWPNVFFSAEAAKSFRREYIPAAKDIVVFGISMNRAHRRFFIEDEAPSTGVGDPGVYTSVMSGLPPDAYGDFLGFDILGYEFGGFHSYLCDTLQNDFHKELGIAPNQHGFFDTEDGAQRCAQFAATERSGEKLVFWLPWRVMRYE